MIWQGKLDTSLSHAFEKWRLNNSPKRSNGLAWFLANEICKRFYSSHGIVPWVICREELGYYGIGLHKLPCRVHGMDSRYPEAFGRLTAMGNVENWRTGGPGDHGLETIQMCLRGAHFDELLAATIRHLKLHGSPPISHLHCRHKRWGSSYALCFEVATQLAIKFEGRISVVNHPGNTEHAKFKQDPGHNMKEHPGVILLIANGARIVLRGDGALLDGDDGSIWEEYMAGSSIDGITNRLAGKLGLA